MNIQITNFSEEHMDEAVRLAITEFDAEKRECPNLPRYDFEERLRGMLNWLSRQSFGKAALSDGKLIGYLLFAGPWDGFFGNVKGVFSPLGGSAFSYAYKERGKLASMLFSSVAQDFVTAGVHSCALSRYAHDDEISKFLIFNGFGIRCMDAVQSISNITSQNTSIDVLFEELPKERFCAVQHLQHGLHHHLLNAPIFFPLPPCGFEAWFSEWINRETMRIFVAKANEKIIGFISVDHNGENFITEHQSMININGAYFDEAYRENGISQNLLSYVCATLKTEGITHIGVDCETLNPTALHFWTKHFVPYTYSFARRIDERVILEQTK